MKQIFVSSTNKDLSAYRSAIKEALDPTGRIQALLNEDWDNEHAWSKLECRRRIEAAQGYFGIFAYYYGWIPNGEEKSITHLEYDWALKQFGGARRPRIAIFMPGWRHEQDRQDGPCPAQKELKKAAELLVDAYNLGGPAHAEKLTAFHKVVENGGRGVNYFHALHELIGCVVRVALTWAGRLDHAADGGPPEARRIATRVELGRLGRKKQTDAAHDAITSIADAPGPGGALLAYGKQTAGHQYFLEWLASTDPLRIGREPTIGRPEIAPYQIEDLVAWVARETGVGEAADSEVSDVPSLARELHRALRQQWLVLMLKSIELLTGGLATFVAKFWSPLYQEMQRLGPVPHRLLFVVGSQGLRESWPVGVSEAGDDVDDFSSLLALPELTDFVDKDLRRWLSDLKVQDVPPGRRETLSQLALRDPVSGAEDATPENVYRRLQDERLWPNGEENDSR